MIRQGLLIAVVFVAVLVLLAGMSSIAGSDPVPRPSGTDAAAATGSPQPSVAPSGSGGVSASAGASGSPAVAPSGASASTSPSLGPGRDPVLVGAGDIADCDLPGDEATATLLDGIDGTVFTAGDDAYPGGTAEQFQTCYGPTWGRHLDRTYAVPGNHDWLDRDLAGFLGYFGTRGAPAGTTWYSFDLGSWHVVMLDSECSKVGGCGAESPQGRWLARDVAASPARCTIAIWHKPRWSSGEHGQDRSVGPFWETLYDANADVVINGHDHDYERFAPQDPAGREDRIRGLREFVTGTGGAELRDFATIAPNSELRIGGNYGVLRLTLKTGAYDWEFIPTAGDVRDAGTGFCH